jgi:4-amino-4-deoxy-L-arabinose transferase-like glycosyltransferase
MKARDAGTPYFAGLLLIVLGVWFASLAAAPLFDLDEGAFSEATREMLASGDFLATTLNGVPRYDKPILVYWLQAASASLFGLNAFALRLPSALMGLLWAAACFYFARRLYGATAGWLAALLLLTSVGPFLIGHAATADALLNALIAISLFALWLWLEEDQPRWRLIAWAAMGLGFLTKGPVALAIPGLVSLIYCLSMRDLARWWRFWWHPGGIALFILLALPWYAIVTWRDGPGFVQGFFLGHNVGRFQGAMEGHAGSLLYYLPVAVLGLLPYSTLFIALFVRFGQLWQQPRARFLLIWFVVVLILFSFSATKLPHYLLYGQTGLIVLMAVRLADFQSRVWALLPAAAFFAVLASLPALLPHLGLDADQQARWTAALLPGQSLIFAGLALLAVVMMRWHSRPLTQVLPAFGGLTLIALSMVWVPVAGQVLQGPVQQAGLLARDMPQTVVMWGVNMPSFSFYARRVTPRRLPQAGEVAFVPVARLADLPPHVPVYREGAYALIQVR